MIMQSIFKLDLLHMIPHFPSVLNKCEIRVWNKFWSRILLTPMGTLGFYAPSMSSILSGSFNEILYFFAFAPGIS
jgi:hypothetical protein